MPEPDPQPQGQYAVLAAPERRAWVRYGTDLDVACRAADSLKDFGWMAKVRNISGGGIGLVLRHRFRPGSSLFIELKSRSGDLCRTVTVKVIHATPVRDGDAHAWLMGCIFAVPISDEEVHSLR
jgi:hypothetical protein